MANSEWYMETGDCACMHPKKLQKAAPSGLTERSCLDKGEDKIIVSLV